jgi:biopolymer transport protein ExbB
MRCRWYVTLAAAGMWLVTAAVAQPEVDAAGSANEENENVKIALQVRQDGVETMSVERDRPVEVIATVDVDIWDVRTANVQVVLHLAEDLNIDNPDDVVIRRVLTDIQGDGSFALQPQASSRMRLRFTAEEGATGIQATQAIKWEMSFRSNTAGSPFSATAALTLVPSNEIVGEAMVEHTLRVRTALTVQQLWADGGMFMWPLGFALILGIAFGLERLWTLSWAKIDANAFSEQIAAAIRQGGPKKAIEVCDATRGPVAGVIREGLLRVDQGVEQVEKNITSAGAVEGSFLQRGMVVTASVTTIAPMMGFLGTVWGMVLAFKAIAEAGDVQPSIVADGISQALITTASGLVIAIIVQSFHNFLISRINRIIIDMEEASTKLIDVLLEQGIDGNKS